jgi:hypothetical protein
MNRQDVFAHHASEWKARIANAHTIMLITHVNPDGDAIGSLLGLPVHCHKSQTPDLSPSSNNRFHPIWHGSRMSKKASP